MQKKDDKHSIMLRGLKIQKWQLTIAVLALVSFLTFSLIRYWGSLEKLLTKLSLWIQLPLLNLILIILLILLVYLALNLLLKIFNNTKDYLKTSKLNKDKIHEKLKTLPREYMNKILILILNNKNLSCHKICDFFSNDKMKILDYIVLLNKAKYTKLHNPKNSKNAIVVSHLPYRLTIKGKRYLKINYILNQSHYDL